MVYSKELIFVRQESFSCCNSSFIFFRMETWDFSSL